MSVLPDTFHLPWQLFSLFAGQSSDLSNTSSSPWWWSSGDSSPAMSHRAAAEATAVGVSTAAWAWSMAAACCVGASGLVPLLLVPSHDKTGETVDNLPCLLSFAVGALLGDVFLHLLPEAFQLTAPGDTFGATMIGVWCLLGLFSFLIMERLLTSQIEAKTDHDEHAIKATGWLNLLANMIDNFTHGMAVAASFSVNVKCGLLTTLAILLHEIPHEIGDFAILLRSGFSRWSAAKAQLLTASGAFLGAFVALSAESAKSAGDKTAWVLPFTAGGFIYISMVSILPDLLNFNDLWLSVKQLLSLLIGVGIMFTVSYL